MIIFRSILALLAITFINSCTTYYYIRTSVADDLSVSRSVHASSSDGSNVELPLDRLSEWEVSKLDKPFIADFNETAEKMTHVAVKHGWNISSVGIRRSGCGNPLLCPDETLDRRFRWFYTFYDYSASFRGLRDTLPLSFEGYLTDEQLELFFRGEDPPGGWNGVEMYYLLDDIGQNFARWYSDATYQVMCDIFRPYCSQEQLYVLSFAREDFMEGLRPEALFAMRPDEFDYRLASVAPDAGFGKIYEENQAEMDDAYDKAYGIIDCFEYSFIFIMDLPGRYVSGNAHDLIDEEPSWKVDAYRLMYGDLKLEATSRKVNVWAFMLTFAVILLLLQIFAKMYAKS